MTLAHKAILNWSGNIGSIEYTSSQCLKVSIGSNRQRSGQASETTWMNVIFTKNQTNTFAPKFAIGDGLHVQGELSVSTYRGTKTTTLFVQQVVEHEPKGVRYLTKLHTTACKLGNQQVLNLMRDEVQLHNLFWQVMNQMFPGTPMPQQMERQNINHAPAQTNTNAPVQQPPHTPQTEQPTQQQTYTPQAEQPAQQQTYTPQAEQPAQQQTYTPQAEQPAQQQTYTPQAEQPVQQQVNVQPQTTQTHERPQQLGQVDLSKLPQNIVDQIMQYQNEGGAPADAGNPNFLRDQDLTVPDAIKANAHDIASVALQNTDNFFKPQ